MARSGRNLGIMFETKLVETNGEHSPEYILGDWSDKCFGGVLNENDMENARRR